MCLVKVRQEEDVVVPYRTVARTRSTSPRRRASHSRVSRTEVIRESRPQSSSYIRESRPQSSSYIAVPAPKPLTVPAPQPVPVFVQPPPPPPASVAPPSPRMPHVVEVSPRSSVTSHSPSRASDYVVHEREYRRERRDYSPARSSAYGDRYETYRYVEPPPDERDERYAKYSRRERSRSRDSRAYGRSADDVYRETRERIVISEDDGRRRREYRR